MIGELKTCPRCTEMTLTHVAHYDGDPNSDDPYMRQAIDEWRCICGYGERP